MKNVYFAMISILLVGCVSHPITKIGFKSSDINSIPAEVMIKVPHIFENDGYSCATTSLAMALSYFDNRWKCPIDKNTAWILSGSNKNRVISTGNDMDGLKRLANHFGYFGEYEDKMSIRKLELLLSKNILVIINIRAFETGKKTHALLAEGYSNVKKVLFVADPSNLTTKISFSDLKKRWSAFLSEPYGMSHRSGFLVYPKSTKVVYNEFFKLFS